MISLWDHAHTGKNVMVEGYAVMITRGHIQNT